MRPLKTTAGLLAAACLTIGVSGGLLLAATPTASAADCRLGDTLTSEVREKAGVYTSWDRGSNHMSGLVKYKYAGDRVTGPYLWTDRDVAVVYLGGGGHGFMRLSKLRALGC